MALLDISLVSEALKNLIENYFKISNAWPPSMDFIISPQPPDRLSSGNVVGIYLYHITEDNQYKNLPALGNDNPPVRYTPMGLNLYYMLSAYSSAEGDVATFNEQRMMGIAIKAMHDYPIIDDDTIIVDNAGIKHKIFPTGLLGEDNRLRIVLQPITPNEAVSYWSAGNKPPRLAAYYQVSVVLLEPEETKSRSSSVLVYGVQTFVDGAPRIDSCKNTISFIVPGEINARLIDLIPAQAPPAVTPLPNPIPIDHKFTYSGTGFKVGNTSLLIKNEYWKNPEEVDSNWWQVTVTQDGLKAVVRETTSNGGKTILPGIYSAIAKVTKQFTLPDGTSRSIEHLSNQCPFAISPRIDRINVSAGGLVDIEGYIFSFIDPIKNTECIGLQIYVGQIKYLKSSGVLNPGEFNILNNPPQMPQIQLQLLNDLISGQYYPLRIFANGAESPPRWVLAP